MERPREALHIAFCDRGAAKYACTHWHYADGMPVGALVTFGVWEAERFIGAVIYSKGASKTTMRGHRYDLNQVESCELARVALNRHQAPVTQIVAATLTKLKEVNPGLRLVISYSDPAQGHHGGIYQAGNWIYVGRSQSTPEYRIQGRWVHSRTVHDSQQAHHDGRVEEYKAWMHTLPKRQPADKHVYYWPFDRQIRRAIMKDALPYPERYDEPVLAEQVSK